MNNILQEKFSSIPHIDTTKNQDISVDRYTNKVGQALRLFRENSTLKSDNVR